MNGGSFVRTLKKLFMMFTSYNFKRSRVLPFEPQEQIKKMQATPAAGLVIEQLGISDMIRLFADEIEYRPGQKPTPPQLIEEEKFDLEKDALVEPRSP